MADDAKQPKPFLAKLYKMVDEEETSNIISWTVPGDALVIHDVRARPRCWRMCPCCRSPLLTAVPGLAQVEAFVSQLLPQYF